MQQITEPIEISKTEATHLPLGFRKIYLDKIPLLSVKSKLLVYNEKYRFQVMDAAGPAKPISKILQ